MKRLLSILFIFISAYSFAQPVVNRSSNVVTVSDGNLFAGRSFKVPAFTDTAAQALVPTLDSCGKIIYTFSENCLWLRECFPKRWVKILSSGTSGIFVDSIYSRPATKTDSLYYTKNGDSVLVKVYDRNCGLIDGGIITYDSLLIFTASPSVYILCSDGIRRTANNTTVTLAPADGTFDRRDAIILNSTGVTVLTGVPSATPEDPQITPDEILLTYITVPANATTIPPCSNADSTMWDENTGSPESTVSGTITYNANNTVNPYHLTKAIDVGSFTNGKTLIFTPPAAIAVRSKTTLKFFVRLKSAFNPNTSLQVSWVTSAGSSSVNILNGTYGFSRTNTSSYQAITIPISDFTASSPGIAFQLSVPSAVTLKFTAVGNNSNGFYIDYIQLGGSCIVQPPTTTAHDNSFGIVNTASGSASSTIPTDILTVVGTGGVTVSASGKTLTITGSGGGVTADNGLTANTSTNVQLGGTLLQNTTINATSSYTLFVTGSVGGGGSVLDVTNSGSSGALKATSLSGTAIQAITSVGYAIYAYASGGGNAVQAWADGSGLPLDVEKVTTPTNTVLSMVQITRQTFSAGTNGIGSSIDFVTQTSTSTEVANRIISKWTDADNATRTSQYIFTGVTGAATETWLTIGQSGYVKFRPMTVTEAGAIATAEGLMVFVSNTDATFTSIGLWIYQNGAWHAL